MIEKGKRVIRNITSIASGSADAGIMLSSLLFGSRWLGLYGILMFGDKLLSFT